MTSNRAHSSAKRQSRLREFAKAHRRKVSFYNTFDDDNCTVKVPQISFGGRATISDLIGDPDMLGMIGGAEAHVQFLKRYELESRLCFSIYPEHQNFLFGQIGFSIPSYMNDDTEPHPESTAWGRRLRRLGIRYLTGSDDAITFTFPTDRESAVRMVFALAGAEVAHLRAEPR